MSHLWRAASASGVGRATLKRMASITEFRLVLLLTLYENGRQSTNGVAELAGAEKHGYSADETKAALDGLLEAGLVVWEAGGEDHLWRISPHGRDYLATASDARF